MKKTIDVSNIMGHPCVMTYDPAETASGGDGTLRPPGFIWGGGGGGSVGSLPRDGVVTQYQAGQAPSTLIIEDGVEYPAAEWELRIRLKSIETLLIEIRDLLANRKER